MLTDGATLLALIEEANYNYENIEEVVQAKIDECQKQINELKAMSQEQFLAMISKSMFGVAMKEYYIERLEKRIERLKDLPEHIDNLLEYWRDSKFIFNQSIKYYKPYVRQLKQAFEKLATSRFNSKLSSFSLWVNLMSKKEEMFPELFCEECLRDNEIKCKRDKDVKCLHCSVELCGYHMAKHLQEKHCVSITWKGVGA